MGIFDDMFGGSGRSSEAPRSTGGGFFDAFFGGDTQPAHQSGGLFGYQEPILPAGSQVSGYGGSPYGSRAAADKSCLMGGTVTDFATGYVGTPAQIYDRYLAEGRDPTDLVRRYRKSW